MRKKRKKALRKKERGLSKGRIRSLLAGSVETRGISRMTGFLLGCARLFLVVSESCPEKGAITSPQVRREEGRPRSRGFRQTKHAHTFAARRRVGLDRLRGFQQVLLLFVLTCEIFRTSEFGPERSERLARGRYCFRKGGALPNFAEAGFFRPGAFWRVLLQKVVVAQSGVNRIGGMRGHRVSLCETKNKCVFSFYISFCSLSRGSDCFHFHRSFGSLKNSAFSGALFSSL